MEQSSAAAAASPPLPERIRGTAEHYFSDENLATDAFLWELMDASDGQWVAFKDLLTFPKLRRFVIKSLKKSKKDINAGSMAGVLIEALSDSTALEVDAAHGVRRSPGRPAPPRRPAAKAHEASASVQAAEGAAPPQILKHLVLDSGAIIHGVASALTTKAENFWTIPEVLAEIRDHRARQALESLPFELRTKEPSSEAISFIACFSRQTGDYGTLSAVDLKVIALTYMMEVQEAGDRHLRKEPVGRKPVVPPLKPVRKPVGPPVPSYSQGPRDPPPAPSVDAHAHGGAREQERQGPMDYGRSGAAHDAKQPELATTGGSEGGEDAVAEVGDGESVEDLEPAEDSEEEEEESEEDEEVDRAGKGAKQFSEPRSSVVGGNTEAGEDGDSLGSDDEWEPGMTPSSQGAAGNDEQFASEEWTEEDEVETDRRATGGAWGVTFAKEENQPEEFHYTEDAFPSLGGGASSSPTPAAAPSAPRGWATKVIAPAPPRPLAPPKQKPAVANAALSAATPSRNHGKKSDMKPVPEQPTSLSPPAVQQDHAAVPAVPAVAEEAPSPQLDVPRAGIQEGAKTSKSRILGVSSVGMSEEVDDDGTGWVGRGNLQEALETKAGMPGGSKMGLEKGKSKKHDSRHMCRTACVTTDYAMQSVMLQVGLRLLSVSGYVVRRINHHVLRCNACFHVMQDTERLFCERCGSNHISRVSAGIDEKTGELKLFFKKNYQYKLQGTKFSLPKPGTQRNGRFGGEMLLREDQMKMGIWAQKMAPKAKEKSSVFGLEVNEKTGVSVRAANHKAVVGYGKKNPNAARGRERRGKKKRNPK